MTDALLGTKLYAPRLRRGLVTRPRLQARMEGGADARLMLVSAPAGFGKTTILAAWLHQAPTAARRVAWLSLDPADNEPMSFWTYLLTALQGAVPGVGARALEVLADSSAATELVLTTMLNDLAAAPDELWLVLDDYHLVDNPDIGQGVAFLLEHLPPNAHVVLSTRADPDLPLARWRVRGELVEIRAADLRFTPDEATAYLNGVTGLDLAAEEIAVLEERTEGWIAALQLAALSLRDREDASGFIARFAGDDRYVVDYLVEEVLRHQPDVVRGFLLQSAVLERLTGPLCDAVTGRGDGVEMLLALDRANLFLIPLDDHREWYRYHHLFADVLRARLLSQQPDRVPMLHQRASRWYQDHDLTDEAVKHALAARDFDRAADLIELAMPEVRRDRQEAMMYGWLKALPDDTIRRRPVLSLFYGDMLMHAGDVDAVGPRLDDAERALAAVPVGEALRWPDTVELRTLPATIAVYRASLAQARGDAAGTAEHAQRALDLAGPDDHLARGGAAGFLGLAAWVQGDVSRALETFSQAVSSLHAAGNIVDELSSTVVLADLWMAAGRPSKARRLSETALQRAEAPDRASARAITDLQVALSELDVAGGDLPGAARHLEAAAAAGERAGMNEGRYRWFVVKALLSQASGQPDQALALLDRAGELYRPGFFPDVRPLAALKARIWITQGNLGEAADWARDRGVSLADEPSYRHEFDHLTLVRLTFAQHLVGVDTGELADTARLLDLLLDRLLEAASASGRAGSLLEIRLLQALGHDAQGRRAQALDCLARALTQAPEPDGYLGLFVAEGAPMRSLLLDARDHGLAGDLPQRLLSRVVPADSQAAPSDQSSLSSTDPLSDRELEVLRLLDSELTGPEIARRLFVSYNTVRTHIKHIFTKLDVTNRRAAVLRARDRGLL